MKEDYSIATEYHVVAALVRLAHKYQIDSVEQRALRALRKFYPSNFNDFLVNEVKARDHVVEHAISAVNLARLTGTYTVLPAALYYCAWQQGYLLQGHRREDGQTEFLSDDDLARSIDGIAVLASMARMLHITMADICLQFQDYEWPCKRSGSCAASIREVGNRLSVHVGTESRVTTFEDVQEYWSNKDVCGGCTWMLNHLHFEFRKVFWQGLPGIFRVDDLIEQWSDEHGAHIVSGICHVHSFLDYHRRLKF